MRRSLVIVSMLLMFSISGVFAQKGDAILGTWLNQDEDAKIVITKVDSKFTGKIIWVKKDEEDDGSKPNLDNNNPDESLQSRRVVGLEILSNLVWDEGDNEWDDGEIYDPKSGSTYSCYGELEDKNTLKLRGYVGISIIGRTAVWTKVK
jgi:uncharacterized protein (DUF2147 family)|tara:strand:+ start:1376 stop:1822 length:447 start_codon:yes stop_codon:yes gene_type:complete